MGMPARVGLGVGSKAGVVLSGDWLILAADLNRGASFDGKEFLEELAKELKIWIQLFIEEGGDRPERSARHPISILLRGHTGKALVKTGEAMRSIEIRSAGDSVEVGWFDSDIAGRMLAHEFGARIKVTSAIRAFFAAKGFPLRATTTALHVPARSVMGPAIRELSDSNELDMAMDRVLIDFGFS